MTETKMPYQIKTKELIPIIGGVNYVRRMIGNLDENPQLCLAGDYDAQWCARTFGFAFYNSAIIGTAVGGLISLLK